MDFSQFHFAQSAWLWGILAIPAVLLLYALFYKPKGAALLERFADPHLLPHLVKRQSVARRTMGVPLLLLASAWLCGMIAMAGPRWGYTDEQTFKGAQDLVIILDLSQSMNATDVKPSRIGRARQEIEDILDMSRGIGIGLVAYAAVPHMVTPLTDDVRTIRNLLPELDTSLITIQGDRLEPALAMAAGMLKAEPGNSKSILVISDGNFAEDNIAGLAGAAGNATIFTMGIGTAAPDAADPFQAAGTAEPPAPPLRADRLQRLADAGHGLYVEANYTDSDTRAILDRIASADEKAQAAPNSVRIWEERFYIPALLMALLLLPLFRRGASFPLIVLFGMTLGITGQAHAVTAADLFLNRGQQARAALDKGDYKGAMAKFDTPYQRGVVAYRAGAYDKAAALFKAAAAQPNGLDALYDLGNAQLLQGQINDAIADYETVLKKRPGDVGARHNLAIAQEMLAKNDQKQQKKPPPKDGKDKQKNQQQGKGGQQGNQGNQDGGQNKQQGQPPPQQQGKNGQQGNQGNNPQNSQQAKPQQGQQSPGQKQQAGNARQGPAPQNMRYGAPGGTPPRPQRDVNADEWLGRVQSDPGSFLKNQFMIEEQQSAGQQEAPP